MITGIAFKTTILSIFISACQSRTIEVIPVENVRQKEVESRRMNYDVSSRLGDICGQISENTMKICGGGYACRGGYPRLSVCIHTAVFKKDGTEIVGNEPDEEIIVLYGCEAKYHQEKDLDKKPLCNPNDSELFLPIQNRCVGGIRRSRCEYKVDELTGIEI